MATQQVIADLCRRYAELIRAWHAAEEKITAAKKEQDDLQPLARDIEAAARVFGFDLNDEYSRWVSNAATNTIVADTPPTPIMKTTRELTVKDIVLQAIKDAYPKSVRAAQLRKLLEQRGVSVHSKTVGMTLYRLSRDGDVKRIGKADWFFIPEDEREDLADDEDGSGGEAPEDSELPLMEEGR
jgi:hypothetical protein